MRVTSKVKVGGYDYTVDRPEEPFYNNGDLCDGLHLPDVQVLRAAKHGSEDYQNTVFLHEVCHAIIYAYADNILSDEDEEKFVEAFSKGLYQVIKDNPEIFKEDKDESRS